ncbi:MAG TPA: glycosyltransferase [Elusimicrobiales bacterium]|nr:glycosyltransferase [Elusimicrobiales bacterium]
MRILHLPTSVGGHANALSRAERKLGQDSRVMLAFDNYLDYDADIKLGLRADTRTEQWLAFFKLAATFLKIRSAYDIYHFNYGKTLLDFYNPPLLLADLPYYHDKAKLFVTYNGCDARQKFPTMARTEISACHNQDCYGGVCNSGQRDSIRRHKIAKFARYASHMFALNPDLLEFLPKEKASFLPYTVPGHYDLRPVFPDFGKRALRIVHAPTNRSAKGSEIIIAACRNVLKKHPQSLELQLVENTPNERALELYASADILIDQTLVGWYGGIAVEAMRLGKPVMSYIRQEDLKWIPEQMKLELQEAIINIRPDTLETQLENLLQDRSALECFARNGYEYASRWHDPETIAKQVLEKYEAA